MDVKEIRRHRLRKLVDDRFEGKQGRLADDCGIKRPQLSRWLTNNEASRQGIAEESARAIEIRLKLTPGWLDAYEYDSSNETTIEKAESPATGSVLQFGNPLIDELVAAARKINDAGLHRLIGSAKVLAEQFPAADKTNAAM